MPGELPHFVEGKVVEISTIYNIAYVKVVNGNVYNLTPNTPGIDFGKLRIGTNVECEITSMLIRVLSATIKDTHE